MKMRRRRHLAPSDVNLKSNWSRNKAGYFRSRCEVGLDGAIPVIDQDQSRSVDLEVRTHLDVWSPMVRLARLPIQLDSAVAARLLLRETVLGLKAAQRCQDAI
jgi:hypothetical protein